MSLVDLNLRLSYRSNECNIDEEFFSKCLKESVSYDRAVGYFSSNSLLLIINSLFAFLKREGKIRIITSINLENKDIEAIINGLLNKDEVIKKKIFEEWNKILENIENNIIDIFSWMIATEKLEIKIAMNKSIYGIYHEKFGIFRDNDGNKIAFTGSANETAGGYNLNFESLDVFNSNFGGRDLERVKEKEEAFENLWRNKTDKVDIIGLDKALKNKLFEKCSKEMKIKIEEFKDKIENNFKIPEGIELRPYQNEAYEKWTQNKGKGILNMATGTGKTITALSIITRINKMVIKNNEKICYIIICPQIQLINQWKDDVEKFYKGDILICNSSHKKWNKDLKKKLEYLKYSIIKNIVIITTNVTFLTNKFQSLYNNNIKKNSMLIVDECHNIGSLKFKESLDIFNDIPLKLGLSATPKRYNDIEGNIIIEKILGEEIFNFGLKEAIENGYLTEYYYYPVFVTFNIEEEEEYEKISNKIFKLEIILKTKNNEKKDVKEKLDLLRYKRTRLLQNLESKKNKCLDLLSKEEYINSKHNLIYVGAGKNKDDEKYINILLESIKMIKSVEKFTSDENDIDRKNILDKFSKGEISSLLAIKCLDEGINIPEIKRAIILSSTSNPKEYIQRRGRILRKSKNKKFAEIYDFIVLPRRFIEELECFSVINKNIERNLIIKEFKRVEEYLELANNKLEVELKLLKIREKILNI